MRIASSCDFGSTQGSTRREGSLPPPYSWTTSESEKDLLPDVMRTIEDTIRGLDHELRQLSLDIHGERSHTYTSPDRPPKAMNMHFRPSGAQLRGEVGLHLKISPFDTPDTIDRGKQAADRLFYYVTQIRT